MVISLDRAVEEESGEPWQNKITSLSSGLRHIYETGEFSDVEFFVKGKKFKGHRLILGAASPKFDDMLLKPDYPKEITDDLSSVVGFECLFRYIYTGELGVMKEKDILKTIRVAKRYKQNSLIKKCEKLIQDLEINCDNVLSIYNQGYDVDLLKERCLQFIKQNSSAVLASNDFLRATPSSLKDMFAYGCLEDVPTSLLQKYVIRWGSEQFTDMVDYAVVRDLLKEIRILGKLKIQELSNDDLITLMDEYPKLLTSEEFLQFNFHLRNPDRPLPEWCEL